MENASKALIIAGAILIAILLIGIGVGLISAIGEPMDTATDKVGSMGIQTFNSTFEKYVGTKKGTDVLSLISDIITSNQSATNSGSGRTVTFDGKSTANDLSLLRNNVKRSSTYTITITGYNDGYVQTITCSPSLASGT